MIGGLLRKDLRYAPLWLTVAFILLALMLVISVNAPLMDAVDHYTDDWVVHILGFMVITIAFCGPLRKNYRNWVFFSFLMFGVLIELVQLAIPGRNASLLDILANLAGLTLGWYFLRSKYGDWCKWIENQLNLQ
jgi:VanZ family protein